MSSEIILRLENIVKRFRSFVAVDGINLDIYAGEFLTIVGPSGSGKSTLIRLLVGMEEITGGAIWLKGEQIDQTPANKRPTCMVFQSLALFPHMTVGKNIEFPLKLQGIDVQARYQRAMELLALLHLPEAYYSKRIHQCSGGEQQRVALARALAFDPEILFFDEPLSALDYRLRKSLEKELKDLHARTGKTFVYITHSLEEAMVMSDRIAIMNAGKFEQIGISDDIYTRPINRFVAEFMGEVNLFEVEGTASGELRGSGIEIHAVDHKKFNISLSKGQQGILMVRPEFVRFLSSTEVADFTTRGTLRARYSLGSRIQYELEAENGLKLTVENLREDHYRNQVGSTVTLGWDINNTHIMHK